MPFAEGEGYQMPAGNRRASALWIGVSVLTSLTWPNAAFGQELINPEPNSSPPTDRPVAARTFSAEYFERFAPNSAYDMVIRLPGFELRQGDEADRGLGLADTNVLLNGRRISGKSTDPVSVLQDISARSVQRIELLDAASVDIPGLTGLVANVVYSASSRVSGRYTYDPSFRRDTPVNWWNGSVSISGASGQSEWTIGLRTNNRRSNSEGPEVTEAADGMLLATRNEVSEFSRDAPKLTATLVRTAGSGNVFNANLALERIRLGRTISGDVIVGGEQVGSELVDIPEQSWSAEFGTDYEFALGGGRLKLIGLASYGDGSTNGSFSSAIIGPPPSAMSRLFDREFSETEAVLRAEYRWKTGIGDVQLSAEGSYNRLSSVASSRFIRDGETQGGQPDIDSVEERRGEIIGSWSRPLTSALDLQATMGFEVSELAAGSTGADSRVFFRPKGSLSAGWRASPSFTLNAKLERKVDQLSFFDFLSNVDLVNDSDRANNSQLVPPQRWAVSLDARWHPASWLTLSPEASFTWFEDVVESVPISPTEEALGNLDGAREIRFGGSGTLNLDWIGFRGARLDFRGTKSISRLDDPLTGERRPLNDGLDYSYSIEFRHDVPGSDWAWGGELFRDQYVGTTRLTETFRLGQTKPFGGLFVEHKNLAGLTATVWVNNILDAESTFEGIDYVDRRDGPVDFTERYSRRSGRFLQFNIAGSF
ncbi:MAG: TonB-dependent receptor [Blastomonas sp.]